MSAVAMEPVDDETSKGMTLNQEMERAGIPQMPEDSAACDVIASWLLRELGRLQRRLQRQKEVYTRELEFVRFSQERDLAPLLKRERELYHYLETLTLEAHKNGFFGKKKSANVTYGVYGTREQNERIAITDESSAVTWAEQHRPEAVKITKKVLISACSAQIITEMKKSGELPDGFEYVPPAVKPYVTVFHPDA